MRARISYEAVRRARRTFVDVTELPPGSTVEDHPEREVIIITSTPRACIALIDAYVPPLHPEPDPFITEVRRPTTRRVPALPGVDMSQPDDHGIVRPWP